jgi:type IV secretion system protein VirB4
MAEDAAQEERQRHLRHPEPRRHRGLDIAPAIIESCPTRIFLPNERAVEPQIAAIYERFGLNARQIEILSRATPKRDYYCQSRRGNRLFELGLGEVALAFAAASSKTDQRRIAELVETHGASLRRRMAAPSRLAWAVELLPDPQPDPLAGNREDAGQLPLP